MENKKFHYAWIVLVGIALTQIGTLGAVVYSIGVFYAPVSEALGVGRGDVALSQTILALVQAFSLPFVGKFVRKHKLNVCMGFAGIVFAGCFALLSVYTEIWMWYITTAVMGIAGAFLCFLPPPILVNSWFQKKSGLALGIAASVGGLGGAVITPIAATLIQDYGWRQTFIVLACVSAVFTVIPAFLLIRNKPEEKGLQPYGAGEAAASAATQAASADTSGVPYAKAVKTKNFYMLFAACALCGTAAVYSTHMVGYAQTLGHSGAVAASLSSIVMIGTLVCKLLWGALKDKFGAKPVLYVGYVLIIITMVMTAFLGGVTLLLYVGAFAAGMAAAVAGFTYPWMTRLVFGNKDYGQIMSNFTMAYTLVMGLYTGLVGYIYDWVGAYTPAFLITAVCVVIAMLLVMASSSKKNNLLETAAAE